MKYLVGIYCTPENWGHPMFLHLPAARELSTAERVELTGQLDALLAEITGTGELLGGAALADPVHTRNVRVENGVASTLDGPLGAAEEQLAGCFLIDCETQRRAEELAARFPEARFGRVELRPVMALSGQEM